MSVLGHIMYKFRIHFYFLSETIRVITVTHTHTHTHTHTVRTVIYSFMNYLRYDQNHHGNIISISSHRLTKTLSLTQCV